MLKLVPLDKSLVPFLEPVLPKEQTSGSADNSASRGSKDNLPFILLTYAQSLDSRIAARPGVQTKISSAVTKTMTHYLRSRFDGILIGVGTFIADDPGLNCRYVADVSGKAGDESIQQQQPLHKIRPIIVDPHFKSREKLQSSKLIQLAKLGQGLAPIIVVSKALQHDEEFIEFTKTTEKYDGGDGNFIEFLFMDSTLSADTNGQENKAAFNWSDLFEQLKEKMHIGSVMVEGGASVINQLLLANANAERKKSSKPLIDSLVITVGPVFLGQDGVGVSPLLALELQDVRWWHGQHDAVIAAAVGM